MLWQGDSQEQGGAWGRWFPAKAPAVSSHDFLAGDKGRSLMEAGEVFVEEMCLLQQVDCRETSMVLGWVCWAAEDALRRGWTLTPEPWLCRSSVSGRFAHFSAS